MPTTETQPAIFSAVSRSHDTPRFQVVFNPISVLSSACLTQNTRLMRFAIRVNGTYNRTNRGLIRVTLGPFECTRV